MQGSENMDGDTISLLQYKLIYTNGTVIIRGTYTIASYDPTLTIIKCGSDSPIDAAREQWSDGSNTLAVAPGEVVVYGRNYVTNRILQDNGIKIHTIPCSELSRGRGGPRCMSCPVNRDDL